jgi:hypothetical protein
VEAGRERRRQVGIKTPRTKEPTMKKRAYIVILAALVALMAASGASAQRAHAHSNAKQARHSLVKQTQKQTQKAAYKKISMRAGRANY